MSRSVYVPLDAAVVVYFAVECEDWLEIIKDEICDEMPSMRSRAVMFRYPAFRGDPFNDEGIILASNKIADIVVADYCGLVSVSIVPSSNLGWGWADNVKDKLIRACGHAGDVLVKRGVFSNGEALFDAAVGPNSGAMGLGYSSKEGWL